MKGVTAYALSKRFTEDTADALGAVKGAPCEIQSIVYDEETGTTTITFSWTGTSGQVQTDTAIIHDGTILSADAEYEEGTLIATLTVDGEDIPIYAPSGIPSGGTKGQALVKKSNKDGDVEWESVGGGGGSAELEDDLQTSVTVGGITSGTTYEAGTSLETLFRDMLNPVAYPTLTNPSASLTATGSKLLETGATLNVTFTITLNRGSINPQYTAESSYRSGAATGYTFDGETTTTNTFAKTITSAKTSYQGSIAYAQGCQPKDSTGKDYQSPLPAGSVNSNVINYEFVDALWANTANIATVAKLALVSKSAKLKQFDFPAQTAANPEIFDVPASGWNITALEVLNTLSNQWEDCSAEFAITDTSHEDASGTTVAYKRYTCALGYATGARKIRIKWS